MNEAVIIFPRRFFALRASDGSREAERKTNDGLRNSCDYILNKTRSKGNPRSLPSGCCGERECKFIRQSNRYREILHTVFTLGKKWDSAEERVWNFIITRVWFTRLTLCTLKANPWSCSRFVAFCLNHCEIQKYISIAAAVQLPMVSTFRASIIRLLS